MRIYFYYLLILFSLIVIIGYQASGSTFIQGPALIETPTTVTTAAGTTTLTKDSETNQFFIGSTTQTVVLPDATTLPLGRRFYITNRSSGTVTVNFNGGALARALIADTQGTFILRDKSSAAGTWDISRIKINLADSSSVTGVLALINGGTNKAATASAGSIAYSDSDSFEFSTVGVSNQLLTSGGTGAPTWTSKGNLTEATSSVLTITGGSNAVLGSGTTIQVGQSTTSTSGYLSSTDWNTFNGKQDAITVGSLGAGNANGLSLSAGSLVLHAATSTQPGAVSTAAQTMAGNKTFTGNIRSNTSLTLEDPGAGTNTMTLNAGTIGTNFFLIFPNDDGTSGQVMTTNGSGTMSWSSLGFIDEANQASNLAFATSVSSNALTVSVKTKSGSDATSTNPIQIGFRDATASTGTYNVRSITGALSLTVPSGATLGDVGGSTIFNIYVYLIDNGGTLELALGNQLVDTTRVISTTVMNTSSDSQLIVYSGTARSNVPVRLLGKLRSTQSTPGTWASNVTDIAVLGGANDLAVGERTGTCAVGSNSGTVTNLTQACFYSIYPNGRAFVRHTANFTGSPGTWGGLVLTPPSEITLSTERVSTVNASTNIGRAVLLDAATAAYDCIVRIDGSVLIQIQTNSFSTHAGTVFPSLGFPSQALPFTWVSGDSFEASYEIPVSGW